MARIKIKSVSSKDPARHNKLLEILSKNEIYATKILPVPDGFVVITEHESELDGIFNNITDQELIRNQYTPLIPPELKAHRSVLIFRIDDHIYGNDEESIQTELQEQNSWITGISNVSKFQRGRGLKITFTETISAKKAQEKGLLLFSMRIPSSDIIQDKFHKINTCLKCYALEKHYTSSCPKDRSFKVCSECSVQGHTWRECEGGPKKCINCDGDHSTMAMACVKKKEIINNKRKEEKERPTYTYTDAMKKNMPTTGATQLNLPTLDTHNKIIQCIYLAHNENVANPGCYEEIVNQLFKANSLPEIIIPFVPQSDKFIIKLNEAMNASTTGASQPAPQQAAPAQAQAVQAQVTQRKAEQLGQPTPQTSQGKQAEAAMEVEANQQTNEHKCKKQERKRKSLTKITGKDIGLKIYTNKSKGWPETPIRKQTLLSGIESKDFKWTHADPKVKEKEVQEKLVFGLIDLTDCFFVAEDDVFRKIKPGLIEERSPPPRPEKQGRKDSL